MVSDVTGLPRRSRTVAASETRATEDLNTGRGSVWGGACCVVCCAAGTAMPAIRTPTRASTQ